MYNEFLGQIEDFIFVEDKPEKSDIIFVPGNGFPEMAELAARLYGNGYAPCVLPSGKYNCSGDVIFGKRGITSLNRTFSRCNLGTSKRSSSELGTC